MNNNNIFRSDIQLEKVPREYYLCNGCNSNKEVYNINITTICELGGNQGISVRLCKECLTDLNAKIKDVLI